MREGEREGEREKEREKEREREIQILAFDRCIICEKSLSPKSWNCVSFIKVKKWVFSCEY